MSLSRPALERPSRADENLAAFIQARIEQNPAGRLVEINQAGARDARTLAELHDQALRFLEILRDRLKPGESDIVLCLESALDFVPAAWACIYGGYSCLAWHIAKGPRRDQEIKLRLEAIGQRLDRPVMVTTEDIQGTLLPSDLTPIQGTIALDGTRPERMRNGFFGEGSLAAGDVAGDAAFLIATSGTTAAAKIAVIQQRCSLRRFLALPENLTKQARVLFFPFDSITGLQIVFPGLADQVYLQPSRLAAQPLELLNVVEEFRIQSFGIASSALARILDASDSTPHLHDLSSLQHVGLGAEMIVPDIVRRLGRQFRKMGATDLKVSFGYGMTETGLICRTEKFDIEQAVEHVNAGGDRVSVGPCAAGWLLRLVGDDGGPLPFGATGNIEVWSDGRLFSGYRNDPEQSARSFTQDGWFRTGDTGRVVNGALTITGRQNATIIVNAKKISLEVIEAPLRRLRGIRSSLAAAAAVRTDESSTDELAVFFVPRGDDDIHVEALARSIAYEVGRHSGIPVKHLVPVAEADFPLTPTGKVRRDELVRLYQGGALAPLFPERSDGSRADHPLSDNEQWLTALWQEVLKLPFVPAPDDNFFELGGDSLASAELIFAVEEKFSCELPVEAFFRLPTIATMSKLVAQREIAPPSQPAARSPDGGYRLLHKLQTYTGSWPGERLFPDSLVLGLNPDGSRAPIFMLCQESHEFVQVAKHLGRDQPLYGMRSCVGIVSVKDYSTDVIETVCNRYLWEILALPVKAPFVVMGVCQAGLFALALARRLKQIGRTPSLLVLIEWTYSRGRYTEPTLMLYGDQSHTAALYLNAETRAPNWRQDFPQCTVAAIPGHHGNLFVDENVGGLAEIIRRHIAMSDPLAIPPDGQSRQNV